MQRAQDEIIRLAKAKTKDRGLTFSKALKLVCQEYPELASEYRHEVSKPQTVFEVPPDNEKFTLSPSAAEVTRLAKEKAACQGVTFSEALLSVCRERPVLASEYRRTVTGARN
jgi:hypothetical protein